MSSTQNGPGDSDPGTTDDKRGPEDDLVSEDPDLNVGEHPVIAEDEPAEVPDETGMAEPPTDRPGDGADAGHAPDVNALRPDGHPSQAEGEDDHELDG
ncbi:hypothetical protein [Microbacterium marinilacus]|uniref:Sugar ABC transporter ATPase n=1 Tax=Microbacterium marinilacus TaxID=415209 RepID=A0ABP7BKT2_9MICO|nr:hypothetical protein [Microbacterium marinilacus]MBY0690435.1 hypothetical protein [Microbacterium marinilacus]